MIEFAVAAKAAEVAEDEDVVEVPIDGEVYTARRPTVGQMALLNLALAQDGMDRVAAVFTLLESLIGADGRKHVERLVMDRRIDIDDVMGGSEQNDKGLIDQIFSEFSERPTKPSADSASSQAGGGRKSTGRSPGKGSTRSTSPSTDS